MARLTLEDAYRQGFQDGLDAAVHVLEREDARSAARSLKAYAAAVRRDRIAQILGA